MNDGFDSILFFLLLLSLYTRQQKQQQLERVLLEALVFEMNQTIRSELLWELLPSAHCLLLDAVDTRCAVCFEEFNSQDCSQLCLSKEKKKCISPLSVDTLVRRPEEKI